ncbi:MAG: hypothetical protein WC489_00655 [Patescibacteria group bacterium]
MKKTDSNVSYEFRTLLKDEFVIKLILEIFDKANKGKTFHLYPKVVNSCLNKAYGDKERYDQYGGAAYQSNINKCYELLESKYIDLLIKQKIVVGNYLLDEDENLILNVKNIAMTKFISMVKWAKENRYILNYGLFSLNTLTGEAYFKDYKTSFRPGTGYYNLFKELITTNKSYLSFDEIVEIQRQKKNLFVTEDVKSFAKEIIKHLKRKLAIKSKSGKLFVMHERCGYTLLKGE